MTNVAANRWPQLPDPRLLVLLRHWAAQRKGAAMPRRSDIDPLALRDYLPQVWIYRYKPDLDEFVCSLSGEAVNEAWGHSLIGKSLADIMPAGDAAVVRERYRQVITTPGIQLSARQIAPADRSAKQAVRLILPLADDAGGPYGVIGMTLYRHDPRVEGDMPLLPQASVLLVPCADLPADPPD